MKQNKYQNLVPISCSTLIYTNYPTITSFYALLLLMKCWQLGKTSYLAFGPCHCGFSYPDTSFTQIPQCWLATMSLGAVLAQISLSWLVDQNTWPFITENELIIISGHLEIMMHLLCKNPKLLPKFWLVCGYMYSITSRISSIQSKVNVFIN